MGDVDRETVEKIGTSIYYKCCAMDGDSANKCEFECGDGDIDLMKKVLLAEVNAEIHYSGSRMYLGHGGGDKCRKYLTSALL